MPHDVEIEDAATVSDLRRGGRATISVEEAGRLLGVGRHAAYRAARSGELPTLRLGRRVVVPIGRLLTLLGIDAIQTQTDHKEER